MSHVLRLLHRPLPLLCLLVFASSFALGIHNATVYAPNHGFDGKDHIYYLEHMYQHKQIPSPNLGKETHQSPLYYIIGAFFMLFTGDWKIVQYLNTFILWMIIGLVGLALWKVFKKKDQVLIGMFSLAALPMLNIFPAMITNELLSTLWIISAVTSFLYIVSSKTQKELRLSLAWFTASFVLGMWTKVSIEAILPTMCLVFLITAYKSTHRVKTFLTLILTVGIVIMLSMPVVLRGLEGKNKSSNIADVLRHYDERRPSDFFYRLDWIPKIDMYNAHYYSLLGGSWNSFWSDGQNAITPFVTFHKKALILWLLGFLLLPLSLYGLVVMQKKYTLYGSIANFFGMTTLLIFLYFNTIGTHYSSARLTYVMGISLCYALGIAAASKNHTIKKILIVLLTVQFLTMLSFFWIQSWWHVTK